MTRRERMEARLERREQWAQSRTKEAAQRFGAASKLADAIPFGQPILVGHHSEKHARRDQERIHNNMSKGCEAQAMASRHVGVAGSLSHALRVSVFSDDCDVVEALAARVAKLEGERSHMRTVNALFRKKDAAGLAALGLDLVKLQATVAGFESYRDKQPYAKYELSNLGGRISKDRKRLDFVKVQQARVALANASMKGVTLEDCGDYVRVTFAEKPEREILDALRGAGFHWGAGSWVGRTDALPQVVRDLVEPEDSEAEMMHERAHAGVSDPDTCDRGASCPASQVV